MRSSPTTATAASSTYRPDGVIDPRPTLAFDKTAIAADGEDVATLAHRRRRFTVDDRRRRVEVEDALEIASDMPATYRVEIDALPLPAASTWRSSRHEAHA